MSDALMVIGTVAMVAGVIFAALAWWNARQASRRIRDTHAIVEKVAEVVKTNGDLPD